MIILTNKPIKVHSFMHFYVKNKIPNGINNLGK